MPGLGGFGLGDMDIIPIPGLGGLLLTKVWSVISPGIGFFAPIKRGGLNADPSGVPNLFADGDGLLCGDMDSGLIERREVIPGDGRSLFILGAASPGVGRILSNVAI